MEQNQESETTPKTKKMPRYVLGVIPAVFMLVGAFHSLQWAKDRVYFTFYSDPHEGSEELLKVCSEANKSNEGACREVASLVSEKIDWTCTYGKDAEKSCVVSFKKEEVQNAV